MARLDVHRLDPRTDVVLRSGPNWTAVLFFACLSSLHLFIVLTDPAQVLDLTVKHSLLVGVTTIHPSVSHDPACDVYPGDHAFIRHKSFVHYAEARIEASQKLINGVKQGMLVAKEILAEDIFARVCKALTDSRFTAPRIKSFYEAAEAARKKPD